VESLRILWLNHRDQKHPQAGGSEVHFWEIAKRLTSWGNEVTLLSERFKVAPDHELLGDVEIYRIGGRASVHFHAVWKYLRKFKHQYDVVVDDIAHAVPWFTPIYVKKPIIAVVHHVHREILRQELSFPYSRITYLAEQAIPRIYQNVPFLTVSESTKEDLVSLGIRQEMIGVVYNGVDHELYKPDWGSKSHYPHVLYLGRVKRYKNVDHVLKSIKLVAEKVPNVRLSIAGRGDGNVVEKLKNTVRKLNLESIVAFHGEVSEDEKIRLLQQAWVYVTASVREGWGITVIEAAACGTPTIAYGVAGLKDAVVDGQTGLLSPYNDEKTLSDLIVTTLEDSVLREKLSKKAAEFSKQFNWDKTAIQTLEMIKNAILWASMAQRVEYKINQRLSLSLK